MLWPTDAQAAILPPAKASASQGDQAPSALATNAPPATETGSAASVVINGDIGVMVLDINGDEAPMAIDAPERMESDGNEASLWEDELEE